MGMHGPFFDHIGGGTLANPSMFVQDPMLAMSTTIETSGKPPVAMDMSTVQKGDDLQIPGISTEDVRHNALVLQSESKMEHNQGPCS